MERGVVGPSTFQSSDGGVDSAFVSVRSRFIRSDKVALPRDLSGFSYKLERGPF